MTRRLRSRQRHTPVIPVEDARPLETPKAHHHRETAIMPDQPKPQPKPEPNEREAAKAALQMSMDRRG